MSEPPRDPLKPYDLIVGENPPIRLGLHRYRGDPAPDGDIDRKPVLLLHGASANHRTFMIPDVGLAPWLYQRDLDPWLLDWRGSSLVVEDDYNQESLRGRSSAKAYNFNRAAKEDLHDAIDTMWDHLTDEAAKVEQSASGEARKVGKIALLGHCMGSAVIAEAVALGHVTTAKVDRIVLSALGLFYEAPVENRLKSEERVLERLLQATGDARVATIDPTDAAQPTWPDDLNKLYDTIWPNALREHDPVNSTIDGLCNRLSFMYGMPYHHRNLPQIIHGSELPDQFGGIPLDMYLHAARNLRIGQATHYEDTSGPAPADFLSNVARARFLEFDHVTLITGELNRLWHRGSIDRMYEWLCHGQSAGTQKFRKHIFPTFAHQDLFWGTGAPDAVYPYIRESLLGPPQDNPAQQPEPRPSSAS